MRELIKELYEAYSLSKRGKYVILVREFSIFDDAVKKGALGQKGFTVMAKDEKVQEHFHHAGFSIMVVEYPELKEDFRILVDAIPELRFKPGFYTGRNGHIIQLVSVDNGEYMTRWGFSSGKPFKFPKDDFEKDFVPIAEEEVNKLERQRCGRRDESFMGQDAEPLPDFWKVFDGEKRRTCSYCGSLHPEDVLDIIRTEGFQAVERSDKSYKWYVGKNHNKYYRVHDTPEFIAGYNRLVEEFKTKP